MDKEPEDKSTLDENPNAETDRINALAERLEKANAETARLMEVQAAKDVENTLGGSATAGDAAPELTEEDIAEREHRKFLQGAGMEEMIYPPKNE